MAITGVTEEEFKNYANHGGSLCFEIDATDIDPTREFEKHPLIQPHLTSGFTLKPSPMYQAPENFKDLFSYGDSWRNVVAHTYSRGGEITYKRLPSGRYEAKVQSPDR